MRSRNMPSIATIAVVGDRVHIRSHKRDAEATKARKFLCRYSYISLRIHPGSDPPHQCQYLAGDDVGIARQACFERDEYRCVKCGYSVSWETGEMDHGGNTKISRCDCPENHSCKCHVCHTEKHGRVLRFGEGVRQL